MKIIGSSNEGNKIVELTDKEFTCLQRLSDAYKGLEFDFSSYGTHIWHFDQDLEDAFRAIILWVDLRFDINKIQNELDMINKGLGMRDIKCVDE